MSSESFAMTRKTMGPELARLAEEHMKHEYECLATVHTRESEPS